MSLTDPLLVDQENGFCKGRAVPAPWEPAMGPRTPAFSHQVFSIKGHQLSYGLPRLLAWTASTALSHF